MKVSEKLMCAIIADGKGQINVEDGYHSEILTAGEKYGGNWTLSASKDKDGKEFSALLKCSGKQSIEVENAKEVYAFLQYTLSKEVAPTEDSIIDSLSDKKKTSFTPEKLKEMKETLSLATQGFRAIKKEPEFKEFVLEYAS